MPAPTTDAAAVPSTIGEPILALLGGYSVGLVHGTLSHTIDTLSSFIRGSRDGAVENQTRARVTGPGAERLTAASDPVGRQRNPATQASQSRQVLAR
jgi:hypothetical protein